jgi:hypothetical protein
VKTEEAIAVLKEIVEVCKEVSVNHISLKPVTKSEAFELHIEDHFDEKDVEHLRDILQKPNLSIEKHDDTVVIYTPNPSNH